MSTDDDYTPEEIKALVDEAVATGTSMLSVIPSSKLAKAIQANDMESVRDILARRPATVHQLFWETG